MSDNKAKIIEFSQVQKEREEARRRQYERFLFHKVLGCYTVIDKLGLKAIEIIDISKTGCALRWPQLEGSFKVGETIDLRLYFSNTTFLPVRATLKHAKRVEENNLSYYQFGCEFDQETKSYPALEKFVDFVESYSQLAREDSGTPQIWHL